MNKQQLYNTFDTKNLRIVKINDIDLIITMDYCPSRTNIECTSKKIAKFIEDNKIDTKNFFAMNEVFKQIETTDDLEFVKISGYY
jgi:hypothetical protein